LRRDRALGAAAALRRRWRSATFASFSAASVVSATASSGV
jgi:hypothetical protein